jgi:hypothetical protein
MQTQPSPRFPQRPPTEDQPTRPELRVVSTVRSPRVFRVLAIVTAALVAAGGYVHFCLYRHGYRTIPKIGVGFLLQVVTSMIVVVALLIGPHHVARRGRLAVRSIRPAWPQHSPQAAVHLLHSYAGWSVQLPGTRAPTRTPGAGRPGSRVGVLIARGRTAHRLSRAPGASPSRWLG